MKETVRSEDVFRQSVKPNATPVPTNPIIQYGHPILGAPCGWIPIFCTVCHPFTLQEKLPMYGGINAVQLEAPSADLCICNPCMCTPDAHCGCGGVHSKRMPASMNYCNVCNQSIQPPPNSN